jgi:hypothetical protein
MPIQRTIRGGAGSEHVVSLFDDPETRAAAVASFVDAARRREEPVVVVATAAHWLAIEPALRSRGIDAAVEMAAGRFVFRDATQLLSILCPGGPLTGAAFERHVGFLVHGLADRFLRRVSVYGEMVDVLAAIPDIRSVLALEAMWNALAERLSMRLMCGYASAHFVTGAAARSLHDVCGAHDSTRLHDDDVLGAWILRGAHIPYQFAPPDS